MAGARLEPDVEDVPLLAEGGPAALRACGTRQGADSSTGRVNQASAPWTRNRSRKWRTDSAVSSCAWHVVQPRAGIGHAPRTLAADAPVRAERDHRLDPRLAPVRQPADLADRLQCPTAQVVMFDADEPLLGGPEDHRLLATPAMGIAVDQRKLVIKVARLLRVAPRSPCWPRRPADRSASPGPRP